MNDSFNNNLNTHPSTLKKDIFLLVLSIAIAILIVRLGVIDYLLLKTAEFRFLGSFIAGLFFVSIFTVAPAIGILFSLFTTGFLFETSFFAALGAVAGDFLIYRFFRSFHSLYFEELFKKLKPERIRFLFHSGLAWLVPFFGVIIIASPLPDELGLALLGFSRFPIWLLVPFSFILNFVGIFILGLIAKQI